MSINQGDQRILNEIRHGQFTVDKGEHILNWSSPAGKVRLKKLYNKLFAYPNWCLLNVLICQKK